MKRLHGKSLPFAHSFLFPSAFNDYTHYTEHSSTSIDILLVSNNKHLIASGVAEPFLEQDIRFHCPFLVSLTLQSRNSSPICDIFGFILKANTYFVQKQAHLTGHPYKIQTSTNTQKT